MTRPVLKHHRAIMLLEVIIALPLLSLVLTLFTWMLIKQYDITRGMAQQTQRQEVMSRILTSMRHDLLTAKGVSVRHFDSKTPLPANIAEAEGLPQAAPQSHRELDTQMTLTGATHTVNYYLVSEHRDVGRSENSTLPDLPPEYFLIRVESDSDLPDHVWILKSLRLSIPTSATDDGSPSLAVRVVFESSQAFDARVPIRRAFVTTLRAGDAQ